jgi:RNA-directed DNA polymerase
MKLKEKTYQAATQVNVLSPEMLMSVVEVDIHKFFDSVDHIWLLKFLKHRIVDPNILWLVCKFLKAGIMETGKVQASIKGTPQGGAVSPIMRELEERLSKFGLEISKEKTRSIELGRRVWEQAQRNNGKVPTFDILGFTHYCGKTRKGWFMTGHKTSKLRLSQKLKNTGDWLKRVRGVLTLKEIIKTVKAKLIRKL